MRLFLLLILSLVTIRAIAQTGKISGRVVDAETQEPLPFANIFINHTTLGTAADANGLFKLGNLPAEQIEVVFSFVGYKSYVMKIDLLENQSFEITARLAPDQKLLDNIQVHGTHDRKWEDQLSRFSSFFLGETKGALACKIMNPWVLEFKEGVASGNKVLFAEASEPIKVENLFLGYNVTYFLTRFTVNAKNLVIQGNVRFEEMMTTDSQLVKRWEENRLRAYRGSSRHLFASILHRQTKEEGFHLYADKPGFEGSMLKGDLFANENGKSVEELDPSKMVVISEKGPGRSRLLLKKRIEVHYWNGRAASKTYKDVNFPVSWIDLTNGAISVNADGITLDPEDMITDGEMARSRISELLPYDYKPSKPPVAIQLIDVVKAAAWKELQEDVYVTTDKSCYYPGEMIWFKALMKYANPLKRDTLSKVLHVELISSDKKILQSKEYYIKEGKTFGEFSVNETLSPGDYYLRAYTEWMRNYGDANFFTKSLNVISVFDKVLPSPAAELPRGSMSVEIVPDKSSYTTQEKISLSINIKDKTGATISSEFAVSVVDTQQAVSSRTEKTIVDEFSTVKNVSVNNAIPHFPIQYGITIEGDVGGDKRKKIKSVVTIVQGNYEDVQATDTDNNGIFRVSGFQFNDSAMFSFQAKSQKGKVINSIRVNPAVPPPLSNLPAPILLSIQKTENPQHSVGVYNRRDVKMLQEVEINSSRVLDDRDIAKHARADFTILGETIRKEKFGNLLTALQSKVPGLRIMPVIQGSQVSYLVKFNLAADIPEPLLVVNGQPSFAFEAVYDRLTQFSPSEIDYVEVSKFNGTLEYGARGIGGVIAIHTKQGTNGSPDAFDRKYFQTMKVAGYSRPLEFMSPDYSDLTKNPETDYRSTIYWSPSLQSNDGLATLISFYSADLATHYRITVEGMTSDGIPFHAESVIEVRQK